jgi:hypothetical protein
MEMVFVITHIVMLCSFLTILFASMETNLAGIGKEFRYRMVVSGSRFLKITSVEISTVVAAILTL